VLKGYEVYSSYFGIYPTSTDIASKPVYICKEREQNGDLKKSWMVKKNII
jgi:hypothetical protein